MIISHRKKFAFFANQKTGSKAVGIVLRLSGIFDSDDILIAQPFPATRSAVIELPAYNLGEYRSHIVNHMTPTRAIKAGFITLEQLREYDCYAFLRNPKERFLATRASMQIDRNGNVAMPGRRVSGVAPPQHEFFFVDDEQVVEPLDFDDYELEIKRLLVHLEAPYQHKDIPELKHILPAKLPRDIPYVEHQHIKDTTLYNGMKNSNKIV